MKHLAENIRFLRKRDGMSQDALAEKTGRKSYTTVQHWETGHTTPSADVLGKLCEIFSVDLNDLLYTDLRFPQSGAQSSAVRVPVLGRVSAGIPADAISDIIDYEDISADLARTGEFFGLKIQGDCMSPLLPDGCIVIFRLQPDAESGDIVAALIDGEEGVCKQYKVYDIGVALVPLNPAFKPLFFPASDRDRIRIIGKAVEMRRTL